jgi:hypothetical protein
MEVGFLLYGRMLGMEWNELLLGIAVWAWVWVGGWGMVKERGAGNR